MLSGQQKAAASPAMSRGVCYLQDNAYQGQLQTMQRAVQQCHATRLNYDQDIDVIVSRLGFLFLTINSYQNSTKTIYALPYLRLHASCRPSSGLKSRVWPLRLLVLFAVIARPERRFHNHLLRSTAWIIGQPDVSRASLHKRNGIASYCKLITNKDAASLVPVAKAQACGATS